MKKLFVTLLLAILLHFNTAPMYAQSACVNLGNACNRSQQIANAYWGYCWWTGDDYWCNQAQDMQDLANDCYEDWFRLCQVV